VRPRCHATQRNTAEERVVVARERHVSARGGAHLQTRPLVLRPWGRQPARRVAAWSRALPQEARRRRRAATPRRFPLTRRPPCRRRARWSSRGPCPARPRAWTASQSRSGAFHRPAARANPDSFFFNSVGREICVRALRSQPRRLRLTRASRALQRPGRLVPARSQRGAGSERPGGVARCVARPLRHAPLLPGASLPRAQHRGRRKYRTVRGCVARGAAGHCARGQEDINNQPSWR
jgi:hypothetical protein